MRYIWFGLVSPNKINKLFWVWERGMASVVRYLSWLSASQVKVSGLCIRNENKPRPALTGNVTQILLPYVQTTKYVGTLCRWKTPKEKKIWEMRGKTIIIKALAPKNGRKLERGLTQSHSIGCYWITSITHITYAFLQLTGNSRHMFWQEFFHLKFASKRFACGRIYTKNRRF